MSLSAYCLRSSIRSLSSIPTGSIVTPAGTVPGARRYVQAALKTRPESQHRVAPQRIPLHTRPTHEESQWADEDSNGHRSTSTREAKHWDEYSGRSSPNGEWENDYKSQRSSRWEDDDAKFVEHLERLFPPLKFSDKLARRILTHGSHPAAINGHNAGLSFLGRRIVESYLLLFLNSSKHLDRRYDYESILARTINLPNLGEHVGSHWGLGRVMRWTPAAPSHKVRAAEELGRSLVKYGLYKVQGEAVTAIMGGIFHEFGATAAHRVFHTRVLPRLLLKDEQGGLPKIFHEEAYIMAELMSGRKGDLIRETSTIEESVL